jgi:hypothetical protein
VATAYLVLFISKVDESLSAGIFGSSAHNLTLVHHKVVALDVTSCSVATGADTDFGDAVAAVRDLVATSSYFGFYARYLPATPGVPHVPDEG